MANKPKTIAEQARALKAREFFSRQFIRGALQLGAKTAPIYLEKRVQEVVSDENITVGQFVDNAELVKQLMTRIHNKSLRTYRELLQVVGIEPKVSGPEALSLEAFALLEELRKQRK